MSGRRSKSIPSVDPAVPAVERIVSAAAAGRDVSSRPGGERVAAADALWICACVTSDDSPTWLIYDTIDGRLSWQRVADGLEASDLVEARSSAGGHADPGEVLRWLRWEVDDPWSGGGGGTGDPTVLRRLRRKISPAP